MEKAYKNLGYFMLLLLPLAFFGFYKTYFSQFPDFNEKITVFHHLHAAIATIWIVMLVVQPLLMRYRKLKIHRMVGKLSYIVFPLLILSFVPMILRTIIHGRPVNIFVPIADCVILITFYALAIINIKKTPLHMRYMIGTAIVFLGPTIGRIGPLMLGLSESLTQNIQYGTIYLIILGLLLLDRKHKKNFTPYKLLLVLWVMHQILFNILFGLQ